MVDKFKSEIQRCRVEIIEKLTAANGISARSLCHAVGMLLELSSVERAYAWEEEDRMATESSGEVVYLNYELNPYLDKYRGFFLNHVRILRRELSRYKKYQLPSSIRVEWQGNSTNSLYSDSPVHSGEIRYDLNPYALYNEAEFNRENSDLSGNLIYLSCISADTNTSTVFLTLRNSGRGSVYELDATTNKILNTFSNFNCPGSTCVSSNYFYIVEQAVRYVQCADSNRGQRTTFCFVVKCDRSTGDVVARSEEEEEQIYFGITLDSENRLFVGKNSSVCIYNINLAKEREVELRISYRNKKHPCIRDLHMFNGELFMLVYGTFYPFQVFSTDGQLIRVFGILSPVNSFYFAMDSAGNVLFNDFKDKQIKICNQKGEIYHSIELYKLDHYRQFSYSSCCVCILEPFIVISHSHTLKWSTIFFL